MGVSEEHSTAWAEDNIGLLRLTVRDWLCMAHGNVEGVRIRYRTPSRPDAPVSPHVDVRQSALRHTTSLSFSCTELHTKANPHAS